MIYTPYASMAGMYSFHFVHSLFESFVSFFWSLSMLCSTGHDCDSQVRMPSLGNTYIFNANHRAIRIKNQIASFILLPFISYPQDEPVSTMKPAPYGVSTKSIVMVRSASIKRAISLS